MHHNFTLATRHGRKMQAGGLQKASVLSMG